MWSNGWEHWPVISAVCLLTDSGVMVVSNQPLKLGVAPQAHGPPALDGDVAAGGVQVAQDHHILGESKGSKKGSLADQNYSRFPSECETSMTEMNKNGWTYVSLPLLVNPLEDGVQLVDLLHGISGTGVLPDQDKILHHYSEKQECMTHPKVMCLHAD